MPGRRFCCSANVRALAGALFFFTFCGAACHKPASSANRLTTSGPLKPCKLPGINEELLCGKLTVFENRETRSGRTIDLNVVVLPALDSTSKEEPLFHLEGGPGVAATGAADFYAKEGKEYRRHRDVVLVDQRGTGKSNPLTAAARTRSPQDYLTEMYPVEYVKNLRQALEQRADLTQYTTSIAMDDLDDVRAWLGYDRINLFGLSYGTRAVLVYMRQHPDRVRSAILMGVAPTYLKMPLYHAPRPSAPWIYCWSNAPMTPVIKPFRKSSRSGRRWSSDWDGNRLGSSIRRRIRARQSRWKFNVISSLKNCAFECIRATAPGGFPLSSIKPRRVTSLRFSRKPYLRIDLSLTL